MDNEEVKRLGRLAAHDLETLEPWFLKAREQLKERLARLFEGVEAVKPGRTLQEETERIGAMLAVLTETHLFMVRTMNEGAGQENMEALDNNDD